MSEPILHEANLFLAGVLLGLALAYCAVQFKLWQHRQQPAPQSFCPLAVIELVDVPPGQEEEMIRRNSDLFTLEQARRMLNLYHPVAKDEITNLETMLGIPVLRGRSPNYVVRLGRRGFHGV